MGETETRQVPRAQARASHDKALEFLETARSAIECARWTASGLNSIHSGIASADAALIAAAGIRSASQDHGAVIALLESCGGTEFSGTQRRHVTGLLKMKNQVAYEQRSLTETEARQLLDHASRLAKWASAVIDARLK